MQQGFGGKERTPEVLCSKVLVAFGRRHQGISIPDKPNTNLLLPRAGPVSYAGGTSERTYLRKGKKCSQQLWEGGVRKMWKKHIL